MYGKKIKVTIYDEWFEGAQSYLEKTVPPTVNGEPKISSSTNSNETKQRR